MRSSKEDRSWCASCLVGDFTNCVKEVEWRSSANPLSIVSGEVPGRLKSPHIIRRSTTSVPRLHGKERAELLKEQWFAGRWAVDLRQHNVPRLKSNIDQLEFKWRVIYFMLPRLNIDCVTVNISKATTPILIWIIPVYMQNAITRWCWAIYDHRRVICLLTPLCQFSFQPYTPLQNCFPSLGSFPFPGLSTQWRTE